MEEKSQYWFGFRDGMFASKKGIVPCGPYASRDEAMAEREKMKREGNCTVGTPFVASSKADALTRIDLYTS